MVKASSGKIDKLIKVFIVDSHPVYCLGLGAVLEKSQEFSVVGHAADTGEAVAKISEAQPDVLIMDIAGSVAEFADAVNIMHQTYKVKVIALTDSENGDDFFTLVHAGAQGYLSKNIEFSELLDSARLVAKGNSVVYSASMLSKLRVVGKLASSSKGIKPELSAREKQILMMVAKGSNNNEIALECCVSPTTVKAHLRRILDKLEVKNRTQAVATAMERGLISGATTKHSQ